MSKLATRIKRAKRAARKPGMGKAAIAKARKALEWSAFKSVNRRYGRWSDAGKGPSS